MTEAKRGFFPLVIGDRVSLKQGGAVALVAKDNLEISQGGGQLIGAGNRVSISQGGGWVIGAGGSVAIDRGGAAILGARHVRVERSIIGIALGGDVEVEDSRVVLGSGAALMIGLVLGVILGCLGVSRK